MQMQAKYFFLIGMLPCYYLLQIRTHIKWDPCHHGMALRQVLDRGDGLKILDDSRKGVTFKLAD
jgi:hypothetical protein